jgi:hypothetical protein
MKDLTVSAEWKTHPDPPRFSTRSITDENEQPGLAGSHIAMSFHHIVVSLVCALSEMRRNVANPFLLKLHQLIQNSMTRRGPALGGYALTGLVSYSFHLLSPRSIGKLCQKTFVGRVALPFSSAFLLLSRYLSSPELGWFALGTPGETMATRLLSYLFGKLEGVFDSNWPQET